MFFFNINFHARVNIGFKKILVNILALNDLQFVKWKIAKTLFILFFKQTKWLII